MAFTFPAMVAEDPATNAVVKNVSFQVYAVTDTSFTTPLPITDTFNNPLAGGILNSGTKGIFPQFQQATNSTVVIADATKVYAWTINCVQQDSAISSFINTPGSATATALSATYASKANNLSDLASPSTARTNLGLGDAATHPASDFIATTQKGAASGVASLDGGSKLPAAQIPDLSGSYQIIWKPSTAYAAGQIVISPNGQPVKAISTFTSGASYNPSNWTALVPRSITLNVKDFGALGDGVTADDAAFLACLTAAKNGLRTIPQSVQSDKAGSVVIQIPAGDYVLTTTGALLGAETMTQKGVGLVFQGVGKGISNILFTPTSGTNLVTNNYWQSVFFRDLGFYTAVTGCTFMSSVGNNAAQRFQFNSCEWVGFQYGFTLTGGNNNSEWAFFNCHTKAFASNGAFVYIPSSGASDQFLNFWFYGCTHWSTSAPFIDAAYGGSFHIFGLDVSDWGTAITNTAGSTTSPGKLFYLRGTSHALGVCNFEAHGVRMEIKNALGGLLYSEWSQGQVTFRNVDVSSQAGTYNYSEMVYINYINVDGPIYTFNQCTMAGGMRVHWSTNDWAHSHKIVVRDTTWLQTLTPYDVVTYDSTGNVNNFNTPAVKFINCRPDPSYNSLPAGAAVWDATVGVRGELLQSNVKQQLSLRGIYGGPTGSNTIMFYLPLFAIITRFEVFAPPGTSADSTTGTWTLKTTESTPTTVASVTAPGANSAGYRVSTDLNPVFICNAAAKRQLQISVSGVTSNNAYNFILVEGYW